jgi:signal transduction histidine kinase
VGQRTRLALVKLLKKVRGGIRAWGSFSAAGHRGIGLKTVVNAVHFETPKACLRYFTAMPEPHAAPAPAPATATEPIRLLHLEDSEPDHALVMAHLRRGGLQVQVLRVETRAEFAAALAPAAGGLERWDLVLSDYHLPGFNGVQALQMLQDVVAAGRPALPFILVSGQIGEDTAVEAMRNGASDYLLKANLSRLAPAVQSALAAAHTRRAKATADAELQLSKARLQALAQHLQTSVEAERQAIAREIHDDVGGSLTALKFELDGIRRHATEPQVQQRVAVALDTVTTAIDACQRIMQNLRPAILEQGLVAALQWMCGRFEKRTGTVCDFRTSAALASAADSTGAALALPVGVPLAAYRTVQEALTNVSKHAQATHVVVDLSMTGGVLSLEVSDNGRGLAPVDLQKASSFGVRGLHERAATVGGWVELSSGPAGTTLILMVPLDETPTTPDGPTGQGAPNNAGHNARAP